MIIDLPLLINGVCFKVWHMLVASSTCPYVLLWIKTYTRKYTHSSGSSRPCFSDYSANLAFKNLFSAFTCVSIMNRHGLCLNGVEWLQRIHMALIDWLVFLDDGSCSDTWLLVFSFVGRFKYCWVFDYGITLNSTGGKD